MNEENNVGGVQYVGIAALPAFRSINPITFNTGADWIPVDILPAKARLQYSTQTDDNGTVHNYALSFEINRQDVAVFNQVYPYLGQLALLKVTDNNGLSQLIGTLDNPVLLKQDNDTGMNYTDANYVQVTAAWSHKRPAKVLV